MQVGVPGPGAMINSQTGDARDAGRENKQLSALVPYRKLLENANHAETSGPRIAALVRGATNSFVGCAQRFDALTRCLPNAVGALYLGVG